jgi:hypothetical protein
VLEPGGWIVPADLFLPLLLPTLIAGRHGKAGTPGEQGGSSPPRGSRHCPGTGSMALSPRQSQHDPDAVHAVQGHADAAVPRQATPALLTTSPVPLSAAPNPATVTRSEYSGCTP